MDERRETLLPNSTPAPPFTLPVTADQKVSLADFEGQPVVLVFYPADWSPVCGDELTLFNELLPEFHRLGAQILGVSVDSAWSHNAFAKARSLHFPLLSDFHTKGAVSAAYHAYREEEGTSERALYVVDAEGRIAWSYLSPVAVNPGADGVLDALERLHAQQEPEAHP